jgi:hypothetical protein
MEDVITDPPNDMVELWTILVMHKLVPPWNFGPCSYTGQYDVDHYDNVQVGDQIQTIHILPDGRSCWVAFCDHLYAAHSIKPLYRLLNIHEPLHQHPRRGVCPAPDDWMNETSLALPIDWFELVSQPAVTLGWLLLNIWAQYEIPSMIWNTMSTSSDIICISSLNIPTHLCKNMYHLLLLHIPKFVSQGCISFSPL